MKRIKGIIVTTLILCIGIIGYSIYNNSLNINEEYILESTKETSMNNLAIMLQNDEGIYEQKDMDTWPTEGYVFNESLSKCENGGKLSWNNGKVILKTSGSDKCYVYFDKPKPSSFIFDNMDQDFYTSCSIQISYDKGNTWQDYQLSTNSGNTTKLNDGTMLRVNNKGYHDYCSIKICEGVAICSISGDDNYSDCGNYSVSSGDHSGYGYERKDYTVKGGSTYSYSLSYCTCLTGDNDIWVIEDNKKKKKKIKDLKKGDKVLILDETGQIKTIKVKDIKINKVNTICKITLNNGELIRSSMRHLFIAENFDEIMAEELKVGYKLLDVNGNYQEIKEIEIENYPEGIEVYSIITDENNKISKLAITAMIVSISYGINIMDVKAACKS